MDDNDQSGSAAQRSYGANAGNTGGTVPGAVGGANVHIGNPAGTAGGGIGNAVPLAALQHQPALPQGSQAMNQPPVRRFNFHPQPTASTSGQPKTFISSSAR